MEPLTLALAPHLNLCEVLQTESVCKRWRELSRSDKWVKRCVLSGNLRPEERRRLWPRLAGVDLLQDRWHRQLAASGADPSGLDSQGCFLALATKPLAQSKIAEIERDVNRTFPTHPRFRQGADGAGGREQLLLVLRATVAAEPSVGYCQGMNFVAAVLLLCVQEPREAFWMMLAMMDGYHFRHVFAPGVPLLPLRIFQFSGLVREHLPPLSRHLVAESNCLAIFAHQCVMTLFAYSIDPSFLVYVWDAFFFLGWKAVFRIGLGLLATLQQRLLLMGAEDISRLLNSKKLFELGSSEELSSVQSALHSLLKIKISDASLKKLQYSFKLERWEQLMVHVASEGSHLPLGLERSACGTGVTWDLHGFTTENRPPWRVAHTEAEAAGGAAADTGDNMVMVAFELVKELQAKLRDVDEQTQRDVTALSARIAETEKELAALLKETAPLRKEIEQTTVEREERQNVKKALMETLQVAVKSSSVNPRDDSKVVPGADDTVRNCLQKMKQAENEYFDRNLRLSVKLQELAPCQAQIDELQESKQRAMDQLSLFLEGREAARSDIIAESLCAALENKPEPMSM